jgi:predicted aminopeptidase
MPLPVRASCLTGILPGLFLMLSGCSTMEYLWQAGRGQLSILNKARPLDEVIRDETTPTRIRALLEEVPRVKSFGERFGMKPTRNYEAYVKLDRDAVVYVVSACAPLKFEPKEWKFPIVGGFPYLGWYERSDADRYGEKLRAENFDVDVRGASAYSTLGWFHDPILSTMIIPGDEAAGELAEVVLHESLHATVYVNHQAFFNESLASFVSEGLTPLYLAETRGKDSGEEKKYRSGLDWQTKYYARMHEAYEALDVVYKSADPDEAKLAKKTAILDKLKTDVKWRTGRPLNNATLIGFREYGGNRGTFDRLFERCAKDWPRFIKALHEIQPTDFPENQTKDLSGVERNFKCG